MSERHPLTSEGSWVQIRDPRTFKSGDKRRVMRAIQSSELDGETTLSFLDGIAVISVEAWSLPLPIPAQDITVLDMMEIPDYDKLTELVAPAQEALFPTAPEAAPEQTADPASPTEPSAA